jgi:CheY-like chemotaxis protein
MASPRSDRTRTPTILVVDDDKANITLLTRMLERAGCGKVVSTSASAEAVGLFVTARPDLVLLDLHMPDLDGLTLMDELHRTVPESIGVPILMLSGDADQMTRQQVMGRGATDFLAKPFDYDELVGRVNRLLGGGVP